MEVRSSANRLDSIIDNLSFGEGVRSLVEILNRQIEAPEKIQVRLRSHPAGFAKEITKRRLSIAEAYLRLVTSTGVDNYQTRLDALDTLIHQALHSKTLSMPINTARVQTALMKECVKARGDLRRQLELMSDFAVASYGQPGVIRKLLGELDLIEVPEDGRTLREMDLGWDDHVHDALTEGRKTPSQLLLDAFIQGISRVTVVYYDLSDPRIFEEALEAGRILGIKVEVGIEFSVGPRFGRQHFMYVPEGSDSVTTLIWFLEHHREALKPFFDGLAANAQRRKETIGGLLERFNQTQLRQINARYRTQPFLQLGPLSWADMEEIIHGGQASRIHLGQLLAERLRPILHKRVLYLKNQERVARDRLLDGETSSFEVDNARAQYLETRAEYENCSAETLRDRFAGTREETDYDSAFLRPEDVLPSLAACGGRIIAIHPLSQGAQAAIGLLLRCHEWISGFESFNLADSIGRDPADVRRLNHCVALLNRGAVDEVLKLLGDWGLSAEREQVEQACAKYCQRPLKPYFGTDYVGRDSRVPGMGFIHSRALKRRDFQNLLKRRRATVHFPPGWAPNGVPSRSNGNGTGSNGSGAGGNGTGTSGNASNGSGAGGNGNGNSHGIGNGIAHGNGKGDEEVARILVLAPSAQPRKNLVGDEPVDERIGLRRAWRYLNPTLKSLLKVAAGMVPGCFVVGPGYTLLWFAITGIRNILVDLVAAAGFQVRSWRLATVDRENLANSLFFTGFSVPILGTVKFGFDLAWPAVEAGFLRSLTKFWALALANGLYLSTHNKLRGFDSAVVRGNFFRSVLSWPLATAGSYVFDALQVPSIVQTKFWSDVVAGIIEGTSKVMRRMRLSMRNIQELLLAMRTADREARLVAMADILFVWSRRYQGRAALKELLEGRGKPFRRHDGTLIEHDARWPSEAYQMLLEAFSTEGSMEAMTSLMLQNYSGRDAVVLTDLMADEHQAMLRWLKQQRPRPAPVPETTATPAPVAGGSRRAA